MKHAQQTLWWKEAIGWYGTVAVLGAFGLLSFGYIQPGLTYQILNLTGAAAIVFIAYQKKAYEPATLNAFWFVIAFIAIVRLLL